MFRKFLIIFILSISMLLSGCGSSLYFGGSNLMKVHKGMTMQEVTTAVGNPDARRFKTDVEEWEYHTYDNSIILIDFQDGKVISMDTLKNALQPNGNNTQANGNINNPSSDNFISNIIIQMRKNIAERDQLMALREALGDEEITCAEGARIIRVFSFDSGRLKALGTMLSHFSDNNYNVILDAFPFISGKESARKMLFNSRRPAYPIASDRRVMSGQYLNNLLSQMNRSVGSNDKTQVLQMGMGNWMITCSQCAAILKVYSFDSERMPALKLMAQRLVNDDYDVILDRFTFSSSQDEALKVLQNAQRNTNYRR